MDITLLIEFLNISNCVLINVLLTEKSGKFLSFLKAKSKPIQPRKPKTTFELKTSLKEFKRKKVDASKIPFNIDPNFKGLGYTDPANKPNQADQMMAPAPMMKEKKKKQ